MPQQTRFVLVTVLASALLAASAAAHVLSNGLTVRIHGADELAAELRSGPDSCVLALPDGTELDLLTGVDDPRLPRRDVTVFTPVSADVVCEALAEVDLVGAAVAVDVYLLPAPPAEILGSFARRNAIYLSPTFGPADPVTLHALVVHELGHVLTWAYFDRSADAWDRYADVRGLTLAARGPEAPHAERAREILAEDIRALCGGPRAASTPIENVALAPPSTVIGLRSLFGAVLTGSPAAGRMAEAVAWPNPCRPSATVEMSLPADKSVSADAVALEILDVRGRVVKTVRDGRVENGRVAVFWDGRDADGRRAAAGRYYYRIRAGETSGRGSLTVLR